MKYMRTQIQSTRVLLADDHGLFRAGVRGLLQSSAGVTVVGEAADGREAVRLAEALRPDVVVMDIRMPNFNGMDATRKICGANPRVSVIALSMHADRRFVRQMFAAGARGYLRKDCDFQELLEAIRVVRSGEVYLSPQVAELVASDYHQLLRADGIGSGDGLTPREREVLQLLADGKSTKQAARLLHVSVKTVESHRRQVLLKTGADGIAELTKYAIRCGLTTAE